MAISRPSIRLMAALVIEPPPSETTLARPKMMMAKYSGEEKVRANLATGAEASTALQVPKRSAHSTTAARKIIERLGSST